MSTWTDFFRKMRLSVFYLIATINMWKKGHLLCIFALNAYFNMYHVKLDTMKKMNDDAGLVLSLPFTICWVIRQCDT